MFTLNIPSIEWQSAQDCWKDMKAQLNQLLNDRSAQVNESIVKNMNKLDSIIFTPSGTDLPSNMSNISINTMDQLLNEIDYDNDAEIDQKNETISIAKIDDSIKEFIKKPVR